MTNAAEEPFIVYSYVGAAARAIDEYTAEGILELRPELRHAGGLLAAPLGLMSTSGTGVTVHIHAAGAPTRIDVHMYESGDGVERVKVDTKLLRVGRTQVFAEARFTDADNPDRRLGYSTVSYVATGPGTGKLENHDEPPYVGPARNERPITEIYGGVPRADGGFDIRYGGRQAEDRRRANAYRAHEHDGPECRPWRPLQYHPRGAGLRRRLRDLPHGAH
jgi:hypothetical protein